VRWLVLIEDPRKHHNASCTRHVPARPSHPAARSRPGRVARHAGGVAPTGGRPSADRAVPASRPCRSDREAPSAICATWRPLREDSFDIATSQWHAVIMDRFLAERRERRLDSHEAVLVAVEEGGVTRLFHHFHDPAAFAALWSR